MINAAIIGMGRWGQTLVNSVAGGSDVIRFTAGMTRTLSKVEDYAAQKGIRLHGSYEDVLADNDVNAVVLASPHSVHFDQMMAAADAGKHVFCEKPFCLTGAHAKTALDTLAEKGLKILRRNPSSFTPLLDGRSLTLGPDMAANQQEIAQFSKSDAEAYPKYCAQLERIAQVIEPLMQNPASSPLPLPNSWRSRSFTSKVKDSARLLNLYQSLGELGEDLPAAMDFLTGAARPILENTFESEVLRATLGTDAIIGSFQSLSAPGSAYVLLHHVMGKAGGERGVWGYVQGGMGALADALALSLIHISEPTRPY